MIQKIENLDLSFPFDEKFYLYNSTKNIVYYENGSDNYFFFISLCLSLIKENKKVLYCPAGNKNLFSLEKNILKSFKLTTGELYILNKKITKKSLEKFLNKKIDCIIIEDFSKCNIGVQIPNLFLEFDFDNETGIENLDLKKNRILQNLKTLNVPFIILGNSQKCILNIDDFDYVFKMHIHSVIIKHKVFEFKIEDIKNRYSNEIHHDNFYIDFYYNNKVNGVFINCI